MKSLVTYTSTLPKDLMKWIEKTAKEAKVTKKQIIQTALLDYQKKVKQQKLKETFKRAAKDKEVLELAEFGLNDYLKQLD